MTVTLPALTRRLNTPLFGWGCLAAASLVAVVVIRVVAGETTFSGDEWAYLHRLAHDPLPSAVFEAPAGQYLIAVPMLIYAALASVFGTDAYVPYQVVGLLLLILGSGLLFELTRRRIGYLAALPGAILLLFFGAAFEVVAIPMRMPGQLAICAGLGMLLALDREDRRGDVAACVLCSIAVVSHPASLAFIAAAAARVAVEGRFRDWRRIWIPLVPAAIYGLWALTLRVPFENPEPTGFSEIVSFIAELYVALIAAVTGAFHSPWTDGADFVNGWSIAFALAALALAGLVIARARRFTPALAAAAAALAVAIVAPAMAPGGAELRIPEAPRYLYPAAVLLFLVMAELLAPARLGSRGRAIAAGVAGLLIVSAMYSNVATLDERGSEFEQRSATLRAELGGLDLARADAAAVAQPSSDRSAELRRLLQLIFAPVTSGEGAARARAFAAPVYYEIASDFGSPAYDAAELRSVEPPLRAQADRVVAAVVPIALEPAAARSAACRSRRIAPPPGTPATLSPGRYLLEAGKEQPPSVSIGRLADQPVDPLEWPAGERSVALTLPEAGLGSTPWKLSVPAGQVRICGS